ncbi:MAG: hypothetical protein CR978_01285 [Gammaproteobacteria bacterium]|nr:MAG: hypothetical protein CR978_01285 [Gammaproteobacteria bacterium]PIE38262.1 MAG: hypothetical protein CSA53_04385 [Gammaproteobacteria bacterium]
MKIILLNRKQGASRSLELGRWSRALLSVCCVGLPLGMLALGYYLGSQDDEERAAGNLMLSRMQADVEAQSEELHQARQSVQQTLKALTLKVAELRARLLRLDALGEHLTSVASLDAGEFDFSQAPALGGPELDRSAVDFSSDTLMLELDELSQQLLDREQQLGALNALLTGKALDNEVYLSGRPIKKGWISSYYGRRTDPFTGKPAMHKGIDFAGREGSDIVAVAAGVVTRSSKRNGYGYLVEISHGDGVFTRYAHNKKNLVKVGDLVSKGQSIALMGSTGRSTGAHVHFEVFKNGRHVDPSSYVRRTHR